MIVERILAHRLAHDGSMACSSCTPTMKAVGSSPKSIMPTIDGLLIEVGGVVYDDTCWWRWLAQVLSHAGVHTRHDALLEVWKTEFLQRADVDDAAFWDALRRCLIRLGLARSCCDEIQAAATAQRKTWEASLHAFPGVSSTLSELARRFAAVVAVADSSCLGSALACRLRLLSLSAPFRGMVSAGDSRRSLADPAFYPPSLAGLGLERKRTALVSNKAQHLAAASAAGLATIAVGCSKDVQADLHFERLAGVLVPLRGGRAPRVAA
jgi:FMN phosphatase YigB (HAD superfamily)